MPLLDHFHPPLSAIRHWESFHTLWAGEIVAALNGGALPDGYFAEAQVHVGGRVEVDVATFEVDGPRHDRDRAGSGIGLAIAPRSSTKTWAPPAPAGTIPWDFPDSLEVLIFNADSGPTLAAAVELVSPGNKDRSETRKAFTARCTAYLRQGVGLVIIDIVTNRRPNMHNELMAVIQIGEASSLIDTDLYASSYRPRRLTNRDQLEYWAYPLAVQHPLPIVPLALMNGPSVPLDLDATYQETCARSRLA